MKRVKHCRTGLGEPEVPLSALDWNFNSVPDSELVACCYWEYARESAFIRKLKKRWVAWNGLDHCPDDIAQGINRIQEASPQVFVRLQSLLQCSSFPKAWQALAQHERDSLVNVDFVLPPAFQRSGSVTEAERLLEQAHERVREFRAAEERVHQKYPGYGSGTLRRMGKWPHFNDCCSVLWDDGSESTLVRIAWEEFTNEEIVKEFKSWVDANRPSGKGDADHRGKRKGKGFSSQLTWLGMMRLMHVHAYTSIKAELPEAWPLYRSADWPRARKKALGVFRKFYPFLPAKDLPLHWPTAGKRSR